MLKFPSQFIIAVLRVMVALQTLSNPTRPVVIVLTVLLVHTAKR